MKCFVLLCHQRSGSTLLVRALQQHPELRMHGEVLTNTEDHDVRQRMHSVGGRWFADGDDGAAFVEHLFTPLAQEAAAGFKLMHYHAVAGPAASAWDFLRRSAELHVIHLRRDDLLRCLLSDEIAQRTRTWHVLRGGALPEEPEPFALTVDRCRALFDSVSEWVARTPEWFPHQPRLDLEYQRDLETDFHGTVKRVFEFLGVAPIAVEKRNEKMARRSPREQLANFDELARAFAGTRYARFFR